MAARVTGDTSDATHLAGNAVTDRTKAPGACGSVDTHHAADAFTDFALMSYNIGIQNAEVYGGRNWTNKHKRLQDDVKSAANLPKSTSDDSHLAGDSTQSENKHFAGMAAEVTEGTSDDTHLADDSKSNVGRVGSDGPPAAREGGPPPTRNMMQQIELVMMNGELLTTFKREDLENRTVEGLIEHLEWGLVTGADGAKRDDLGVFLERFSLVIRNEVMQADKLILVTDYFHEGEEPIRITLVKKPVEEAIYKQLRREAELEE